MINSGLDVLEQEELNRISASLTLDKSTKTIAWTFLCEYKQKTRPETTDKPSIIVCCAILAASKSQIITTVKGEKIRGIGISITQILRTLNSILDNFNSSEFLAVLKEFISTITLETEVSLELKQIIDKFAFSYTFYTKYKNIFKQLELKESDEYLNLLQNLGWLIFINARQHILQNRTELVETVYLLAATFVHILYYIPDSIAVLNFQRNGIKIHSKEKQKDEEAIICAVREQLKITYHADDDAFYRNSLQKYLEMLLQNEVLKSSENSPLNFEGMFDQASILSNTRKLENYYQKKLVADELDERFYMKDRKANTPGKFTPFAKQGAANKLNLYGSQNIHSQGQQQQQQSLLVTQEKQELNDHSKKIFHSHRVLNYEATENVSIKSNLSEIKFTNKTIPQSPYTKLMPATPMTAALEMYNWLSEKVRKLKKVNGINTGLQEKVLHLKPSIDLEAMKTKMEKLSEQVLLNEKDIHDQNNHAAQINSKKYKDYHTQTIALYVRVVEELILQIDRKTVHGDLCEFLRYRTFHQALIACCIETVFFINNSSNMAFLTLLEKCEIQPFDFWTVITFFVKSDTNMPFPIKKHLHDLEIKIITQLAWRKGSQIHQTIKAYFQKSTNKESLDQTTKTQTNDNSAISHESSRNHNPSFIDSENNSPQLDLSQSQEFFFQRVLHHTAGEIYQLSELLNISDRVSESIWVVMKYILSTEPDLLIDRHLTQLILCTVYGNCKMSNQSLKFQEIIAKYHELPTFNRSDLSDIIYNVHISEKEKGDLVRFYNAVYISELKSFLFTAFGTKSIDIKSQTPQIKKPLIPALALASPLKDSLPQNIMNLSLTNSKKSPMLKQRMTPTSNAPYVFNDFSLYGADSSTNNISSKRLINFEECNNTESSIHTGTENTIKVPKYSSLLMEKIVEQKHEDVEDSNKKVPSRKNLFGSTVENDSSKEQVQGQGASKVLNFDAGIISKSESIIKTSFFPTNTQKGGLLGKPSMNIQPHSQAPLISKPKGVRLNFDEDESTSTQQNISPSGPSTLLKNSEAKKGSKLFAIDRNDEDSLSP